MTNFIIKNDILFSLEKSEGTMDFPRKFFAKKVSGNQIKISTLGSNEVLLVDVWQLDKFTIDGTSYIDVHEAIVALQPIIWNEATGTPPIDYTPLLEEIISEIKNDDAYQLFEDTDGNILFGKIDNDGVMKYYKADGSVYTGDIKPYSREVAISYTDYCAEGVPFTLIQFRDIDTKIVVATLWRNDNDLTENATAPANSTKGVCVVEDLTGKDCATPIYSNICNFQELADAINAGSKDYTSVLDSIDGKLDDIALIKTELVTANTTLSNIKTDTAYINNNLLDIIGELEAQTTLLTDIKAQAVTGNVKLEDIKALLVTIDANILSIKDDLATIKTDIADIKTGVQSIDTKLDTVITSLSSIETKLDTLHDDLTTINTTLQTEFDQTQVKLDELKTAIEFAQDTFQAEDCDGNAIGTEQNVLKVMQLNKQTSVICNASDIYEPIVGAITSQTPLTVLGKRHSAISLVASVGDTFTVPDLYTTVSMFVAKGEFKVTSINDFSLEITKTGGVISSFIELSSDGIGTATGATDVPQSLDTRANTKDLESDSNGYTIECVREGVIQLELYKD